jgi:hypothetical protein
MSAYPKREMSVVIPVKLTEASQTLIVEDPKAA